MYCGSLLVPGLGTKTFFGRDKARKELTMPSALENVSGWEVGQLAAVVHKLGVDNARKLLNCNEVTVTFGAGNKTAAIAAEVPALQVWRTLKLGTGLKTADDFRKAIGDNDMRLRDEGSDILEKPEFTAATEPCEVDLVVMSVKDLGFKGDARYDQICAKAKELGLDLCPAEVGPQLRLQYSDQKRGERLIIAMETIRGSHGDLGVFSVGHGGSGRWLGAYVGNPDSVWYPNDQFVFVSRKKPSDA